MIKTADVTCGDKAKRIANKYDYLINETGNSDSDDLMIKSIRESSIPEREKEYEIGLIEKERRAASTQITEYIWVVDGDEMDMAIKKIEKSLSTGVVLYKNVLKVEPNKRFDEDLFSKTLEQFKIKVMK
jgi:hypothetical protein